jgi:hypothetical protein
MGVGGRKETLKQKKKNNKSVASTELERRKR